LFGERLSVNNDQGKPRSVDDYQPRVQISRLFKSGSLNLENNETIENFSMQYATDSDLVKKAIEHFLDIKLRENIQANQRKLNVQERNEKGYDNIIGRN